MPLLTALQAGEFREADFITRAALIKLAGEKAIERGYVYFSEAPNLPVQDMATIERLWNRFSKGKFGYSVQKVRREVQPLILQALACRVVALLAAKGASLTARAPATEAKAGSSDLQQPLLSGKDKEAEAEAK